MPPCEASVQADVARRLFEAVAEDERLRGDLTDEGYAPLLAWCAQRVVQLAAVHLPPGPSPARGEGHQLGARPAVDFDRVAAALRATLAAIVRAAESGDGRDLAAVAAEIVDPSTLPDLRRALAAAPYADARARSMAAVLAAGRAP